MDDGKSYRVIDWTIENFTFWNREIHYLGIKSLDSQTTPQISLKLYPRGHYGNDHLLVHLSCRWWIYLIGGVSFIGPDGFIFYTKQMGSRILERTNDLKISGPKYQEVVDRIRLKKDLYGDRVIVRCKVKYWWDSIEHIRTTINVLDFSFQLYPEMFSNLKLPLTLLSFPIRELDVEPLVLEVSKDRYDRITLALYVHSFHKNVLVRSHMTVLSKKIVVRSENAEHLFTDDKKWYFSDSLTNAEAEEEGFSLILNFKISPTQDFKHSHGFFQHCPFKIDFFTADEFRHMVSTGTLRKLGSSVTVLSKELMCLYQDQDFSDFQIKCGDVTFPVHKNILSARSPVFKTMLCADMKEAASGSTDIRDLDTPTLTKFLAFLYTGAVDDLQSDSALKLYFAADKYQVPSLKKECFDYLSGNISIANVCDILSLANRYQNHRLTSEAHNFLVKNYNKVLGSEEWKQFMRNEPLLALET